MRRRRIAVLIGASLLGVFFSATWSFKSARATDVPVDGRAVGVPLTSSTTTPSGAEVVVKMGLVDTKSNAFWELFVRTSANSSWRLRTPPGVADNGGLVVASASGAPLTVGFLPSAALTFSPIAQTENDGTTWRPATLSTALDAVPDGLVVGSSGALLAITTARGSGAEVTESLDDGTHTKLVASTAVVRKVLTRCGAEEITALGGGGSHPPLIGTSCGRPGEIGLALGHGTGTSDPQAWHDIGFSLVGDRRALETVVRLGEANGTIFGIAVGRSDRTQSVTAFWQDGVVGRWVASRPMTIPSGWTLQATATGGAGGSGVAVLLAHGAAREIADVAGPGSPWHLLPSAPRGTSAIATIGSETDAFVVASSHLTVWAETPHHAQWRVASRTTVPIQYGSSS